jgi:hypothetical protein
MFDMDRLLQSVVRHISLGEIVPVNPKYLRAVTTEVEKQKIEYTMSTNPDPTAATATLLVQRKGGSV